MANIEIEVVLPGGEVVDVVAPEEWTDDQIRAALEERGVLEKPEEPGAVRRGLFGAAKEVPLVGQAQRLIEQKLLARPEQVIEEPTGFMQDPVTGRRLTAEEEDVPTDEMLRAEFVQTGTRERVIPAVTEEDIRRRQHEEFSARLAMDFPDIVGTEHEESTAAKVGGVARMLTDMATFPLPFGKQKQLGETVKQGRSILGSAQGRKVLGEAIIESGGTVGVFAGSESAVRQLAETGEIDPAQLATATAIGALGGATVGPLLSVSGGRMAGWFDRRSRSGKPVTVDEVQAAVDEFAPGTDMTPEQFDQLAEAMNQLQDRARVEAATIDAMFPKATARTLREEAGVRVDEIQVSPEDRAMRESIREAFEKGETATRDQQMAELARLEAERTVPTTAATRIPARLAHEDNATEVAEVLLRNETTPRTKRDEIPASLTFGQKTAKRMEDIAPRIAFEVRGVTSRGNRRTNERVRGMLNWTEDTAVVKAMKRPDYKAAVLNRDVARMNEIAEGTGDAFDRWVAPHLDEIKEVRRANGLPVLDNMFPRAVASVKKLRKELGRADRTKLDLMLAKAARGKGRDLTEDEVAGIIGQLVGGRPLAQDKTRRIREVTPAAARHYQDPRASLLDHVHKFEEDRAAQEFFSNALRQDVPLGETLDSAKIGAVLERGLSQGDLSPRDVQEMAHLLDVHFGVSKGAPGEKTRIAKDIFTTLTLGYNPGSTITQLGDLGVTAARFGPVNTMRSLFGPRVAEIYSTGVKSLASDMRTQRGLAKVTKDALKRFGFDKLDRSLANVSVNAALNKRRRMALKQPAKLRAELEPLMGSRSADETIEALRTGQRTDDVQTLLLHDVADVRPVGREDMPLAWNESPQGRWRYSLLSWSINQLNLVRNQALREIRSGEVERIARGARTLALMTVMFGLGNVGPGILKDFLKGEELDPVSHFAAGMVPFGMTAKFTGEALAAGQGERALASLIPAYGIGTKAAANFFRGVTDWDPEPLIRATPTGNSLYQFATSGVLGVPFAAIPAVVEEVFPAAEAGELQNQTARDLQQMAANGAAVREVRQSELPVGQVTPRVQQQLELREGNVAEVYIEPISGKPHAGIGHMLTPAEQKKYSVGQHVPSEVREKWFEQDVTKAARAARMQSKALGRPDLEEALVSVNYQLGTDWWRIHSKTWKLLKAGKWEAAANEAANSVWNEQTPLRVKDFQDAILDA